MIAPIRTVARKEWLDATRDRRTLMAASAYTLLGPLIVAMLLNFVAESSRQSRDVTLAIVRAAAAPAIVTHLENSGFALEFVTLDGDGVPELPQGANALLVIPENYSARFAAGEPVTLRLFADLASRRGAAAVEKSARALEGFRQRVEEARLIALGVAPWMTQSLQVVTADLSPSSSQGRAFGYMLLLFFVLAPFFSSMSAAIDSTAGERERDSLQPLLAQPVSVWHLTLGKWLVVAGLGVAGTAVTVGLGSLALRLSPLGALGIRLHLDPVTLLAVVAALLPLALLVAALQMSLAISARSFKEGQTYLTLLSFVPAVLGFVYSFSSGPGRGSWDLLPVLSELRILDALLMGGTSPAAWAGAWFIVALALTGLCLATTAHRLRSERLLT